MLSRWATVMAVTGAAVTTAGLTAGPALASGPDPTADSTRNGRTGRSSPPVSWSTSVWTPVNR